MKDISITKGQNLIETFSYNNWNMLDNHTVSNANADVYDMSYNYSRGWHLIEKADGIKNTSDKYSYDSYYRLKEVKYDFANNTAARTDNFFADYNGQTFPNRKILPKSASFSSCYHFYKFHSGLCLAEYRAERVLYSERKSLSVE